MVRLGGNLYGKAEVRLVHVARSAGPAGEDLVRDWNVSTSLSGDLADSHLTGSNAKVLPTDSQKNKASGPCERARRGRGARGVRD